MKRIYSNLSIRPIETSAAFIWVNACLVFILLAVSSSQLHAQFTAGNVVVLQAGDGTTTLANTGNVVILKEFTPVGAPGITCLLYTSPSPRD